MYNADNILVKQLIQIIERIFEYTNNYQNSKEFVDDY